MRSKYLIPFDPSQYTQDQLLKIDDALNSWHWSLLLGEKPEWWDSLTEWHKFKLLRFIKPSKHDVIKPIMREIASVVSHKTMLRYHHTHNLKRTEEQFEQWWQEEWLGNVGRIRC
jgi:hypothetical protein